MASDETREALAIEIVQRVAELPDRTSPDDWPEAMLVTSDELRTIVTEALLRAEPPPERHRCVGCGLRWEGPSLADICGDCYRELQRLRAELSEARRVLDPLGVVKPETTVADLARSLLATAEACERHVIEPRKRTESL